MQRACGRGACRREEQRGGRLAGRRGGRGSRAARERPGGPGLCPGGRGHGASSAGLVIWWWTRQGDGAGGQRGQGRQNAPGGPTHPCTGRTLIHPSRTAASLTPPSGGGGGWHTHSRHSQHAPTERKSQRRGPCLDPGPCGVHASGTSRLRAGRAAAPASAMAVTGKGGLRGQWELGQPGLCTGQGAGAGTPLPGDAGTEVERVPRASLPLWGPRSCSGVSGIVPATPGPELRAALC